MKRTLTIFASLLFASSPGFAADEGFTDLMDGKTFDGWKKTEENPDTWKIEDGCFVAAGPLFPRLRMAQGG